jgi:hypothetical protein
MLGQACRAERRKEVNRPRHPPPACTRVDRKSTRRASSRCPVTVPPTRGLPPAPQEANRGRRETDRSRRERVAPRGDECPRGASRGGRPRCRSRELFVRRVSPVARVRRAGQAESAAAPAAPPQFERLCPMVRTVRKSWRFHPDRNPDRRDHPRHPGRDRDPAVQLASNDARTSNVQTTVQTLRSQIALYKLQHRTRCRTWSPTGTSSPRRRSRTGRHPDPGGRRPDVRPVHAGHPGQLAEQPEQRPERRRDPAASAAGGFVYDYAAGAGTGKIWGTKADGTTLITP